jgi:hypothetical protein
MVRRITEYRWTGARHPKDIDRAINLWRPHIDPPHTSRHLCHAAKMRRGT